LGSTPDGQRWRGARGFTRSGEARPDSDIDLGLRCTAPHAWLAETSWLPCFGAVETYHTANGGGVAARRVYYAAGLEVACGLTTEAWAGLPLIQERSRLERAGGLRLTAPPPSGQDSKGSVEGLCKAH
jgi:hypothetical protein